MAIPMRTIIFGAIVILVFGIGGIWLQVFLSKKESKWPGLILPMITFCISLIYVLNVANIGEVSTVIAAIVSAFLFGNIPTVVLLVIYAACREKRKRQRALDKMTVQDLYL
jgi:predicted MFS family arabinose efflux permease